MLDRVLQEHCATNFPCMPTVAGNLLSKAPPDCCNESRGEQHPWTCLVELGCGSLRNLFDVTMFRMKINSLDLWRTLH